MTFTGFSRSNFATLQNHSCQPSDTCTLKAGKRCCRVRQTPAETSPPLWRAADWVTQRKQIRQKFCSPAVLWYRLLGGLEMSESQLWKHQHAPRFLLMILRKSPPKKLKCNFVNRTVWCFVLFYRMCLKLFKSMTWFWQQRSTLKCLWLQNTKLQRKPFFPEIWHNDFNHFVT